MTERHPGSTEPEQAAPGDDDTLAPESGPLTPSADPDGGGEDDAVGSPP